MISIQLLWIAEYQTAPVERIAAREEKTLSLMVDRVAPRFRTIPDEDRASCPSPAAAVREQLHALSMDSMPPDTRLATHKPIIWDAVLKIHEDAPHDMATTHKQQVNEELLAFLKDGHRI